ncbi:hypothetical protein BpHYR1_035994 [Brachionus plicatilis]|uniref:Uncharacterized protein n=1 Tax=Brachionus plicatilis TaxID=10195 RepID=A0A3M7QQQ9_BRAPC|nr:hypothetical protein BpHYR1_035994 [Brachionus plicatilis]
MNLNKEKNNPRLILSRIRICKDYLILELQRSFISSTIGPNVSIESNNLLARFKKLLRVEGYTFLSSNSIPSFTKTATAPPCLFRALTNHT